MNKKVKQKPVIILTASIFVICCCVGLYYYLWYNMQATIIEIQELVVQTGEQSSELTGVNMVVNTAKDTKEDRDRLKQYFITDNEATISFIELIEKLAVDADVTMVFAISQLDNAIQFRLTSSGLYPNVYRYVEYLESIPYNVEIRRMNLMKENDALDSKDIWGASLDLVFTGYSADSI